MRDDGLGLILGGAVQRGEPAGDHGVGDRDPGERGRLSRRGRLAADVGDDRVRVGEEAPGRPHGCGGGGRAVEGEQERWRAHAPTETPSTTPVP
jgi:hypothetical protein